MMLERCAFHRSEPELMTDRHSKLVTHTSSGTTSLNIDIAKDIVVDIRTKVHTNCVVCSPSNARGLKLEFHLLVDGSVSAYFNCGRQYESYAGILHGGVLSMILDDAMTNCLFAHECVATTGDLRVRFRYPVATDQRATVRAWITRSSPPIYELKAEIVQNDQVKTIATGKFMEQPQLLNE